MRKAFYEEQLLFGSRRRRLGGPDHARGGAENFVEWALQGWLALIFGIVLVQIATRGSSFPVCCAWSRKPRSGWSGSSLGITLLFAAGYAMFALNPDQLTSLPNIPTPLLLVLIGSNGAYFAVKYAKRPRR